MKIKSNPAICGYQLYCDTDSEYAIMSELCNRDIDPKYLMKCYLNSMYGKKNTMTDEMAFVADVIKAVDQESVIDNTKEKIMKEFIVVHNNDNPVIILKDAVIAVKDDRETEETCLYLSCGFTIRCVDKYRDIVKALIK